MGEYVTSGVSVQSLSRVKSWLAKFLQFLQDEAQQAGRATPRRRAMSDNNTALRFLALVADENKGRTRVAAAARAIGFARRLLCIPPLANDPRLALLKEGVRRRTPHIPRGAVPLHGSILWAVVIVWGRSKVWWKRMTAFLLLASFLSLLRGAGIMSVPAKGVAWIMGLDEVTNPRHIPRQHSGVLLLVPARKSLQSTPSWIPLRAGVVTELLARHVRWHRRNARSNNFLFPSRSPNPANPKTRWRPHPSNKLSHASFVALLRTA